MRNLRFSGFPFSLRRARAARGAALLALAALAIFWPARAVCEAIPSTAAAALRRAQQLTAEGDLAGAEALYRQIADEAPAEGIPALGRFLRLAGTEEERRAFAGSLEAGGEGLDAFTRARGLAAAGEREKAIGVLLASPGAVSGGSPEAALFLARLLRAAGREEEAGRLLRGAVESADPPEARAAIFRDLLANPSLRLADEPTTFLRTLEAGFAAWRPSRDEALRLIEPLLLHRQSDGDNYFPWRDAMLAQVEREPRGAAADWFATRILAREDRMEDALASARAALGRHAASPLAPLLTEEVIALLRTLGRHAEALELLDRLARQREDARAATLRLQAAESALANREAGRALEILDALDPAALPEADAPRYWRTRLTAAAAREDMARLLDAYERATERAGASDYEIYHYCIFGKLQETAQHRALDSALRARLAQDPAAPPRLWRLVAETAKELRLKPNEIEALYQWAKASPGDFLALQTLADAVQPIAVELAAAPPELVAAPEGEIAKLFTLAEQALDALIRARPYDPTYYGSLIKLLNAKGDADAAARVPERALATRPKDPRLLGTGAYALAINGFPEAALQLYDRALALDPDNMDVAMNRASCLTRLDRFTEAADFYRRILEQGWRGKEYHTHELIGRLWKIEKHLGREKECLEYLRALPGKIQGGWARQALLDAAAEMGREKRFEDAEAFYAQALALGGGDPEERAGIEESLCALLLQAERLEEAERRAAAAAESARAAHPEQALRFREFEAEAVARRGDPARAIALLERAAEESAPRAAAFDALFRAAQLAEECGETSGALRLYTKFLQTDSTRFGLRAAARERIGALETSSGGTPTP